VGTSGLRSGSKLTFWTRALGKKYSVHSGSRSDMKPKPYEKKMNEEKVHVQGRTCMRVNVWVGRAGLGEKGKCKGPCNRIISLGPRIEW
jgi:hypothetical protein